MSIRKDETFGAALLDEYKKYVVAEEWYEAAEKQFLPRLRTAFKQVDAEIRIQPFGEFVHRTLRRGQPVKIGVVCDWSAVQWGRRLRDVVEREYSDMQVLDFEKGTTDEKVTGEGTKTTGRVKLKYQNNGWASAFDGEPEVLADLIAVQDSTSDSSFDKKVAFDGRIRNLFDFVNSSICRMLVLLVEAWAKERGILERMILSSSSASSEVSTYSDEKRSRGISLLLHLVIWTLQKMDVLFPLRHQKEVEGGKIDWPKGKNSVTPGDLKEALKAFFDTIDEIGKQVVCFPTAISIKNGKELIEKSDSSIFCVLDLADENRNLAEEITVKDWTFVEEESRRAKKLCQCNDSIAATCIFESIFKKEDADDEQIEDENFFWVGGKEILKRVRDAVSAFDSKVEVAADADFLNQTMLKSSTLRFTVVADPKIADVWLLPLKKLLPLRNVTCEDKPIDEQFAVSTGLFLSYKNIKAELDVSEKSPDLVTDKSAEKVSDKNTVGDATSTFASTLVSMYKERRPDEMFWDIGSLILQKVRKCVHTLDKEKECLVVPMGSFVQRTSSRGSKLEILIHTDHFIFAKELQIMLSKDVDFLVSYCNSVNRPGTKGKLLNVRYRGVEAVVVASLERDPDFDHAVFEHLSNAGPVAFMLVSLVRKWVKNRRLDMLLNQTAWTHLVIFGLQRQGIVQPLKNAINSNNTQRKNSILPMDKEIQQVLKAFFEMFEGFSKSLICFPHAISIQEGKIVSCATVNADEPMFIQEKKRGANLAKGFTVTGWQTIESETKRAAELCDTSDYITGCSLFDERVVEQPSFLNDKVESSTPPKSTGAKSTGGGNRNPTSYTTVDGKKFVMIEEAVLNKMLNRLEKLEKVVFEKDMKKKQVWPMDKRKMLVKDLNKNNTIGKSVEGKRSLSPFEPFLRKDKQKTELN